MYVEHCHECGEAFEEPVPNFCPNCGARMSNKLTEKDISKKLKEAECQKT